MSERAKAGLAVGLLVATTCFMFWPLILGGERFLEWDVPEQYWPDLVFLCDSVYAADLPFWNPFDRAGYPYYADPQSGQYHPLNLALCLVGGSSPPLWVAELRVILGFFFAGAFGLAWLRRLEIPWGPALFGAVIIETAPFMRHNFELNLTTGLSYLPLILWAAEGVVAKGGWRDGVILGLAVALCVWVGSPPAAWQALSFASLYLTARALEERRLPARALAVTVVVAAGLTAVVFVPAVELSAHSVQAGRSLESIASGALSWQDLVALVWPQPGNHLYTGWLAAACLPAAFLLRGARGRWFFAAMIPVAVLLALGTHSPLFEIAFDVIPGVSTFRLPHRYEAYLGPAVGALAAYGLTHLQRIELRGRRVYAGAAACALGGLAWWVWGPGVAPTVLLFGVALLVIANLSRRESTQMILAAALAILSLLDVTQQMSSERHTVPGPHPPSVDSAAVLLEISRDTRHTYRYFDEFGIACRSGTRYQRREMRGYQDPLLLKSFERFIAALRESPRLAEQLNVKYALTGPHFIHGWNRHFLPPPDELLEIPGAIDRGHGVVQLPAPLPAAYWIPLSRVERVASREEALARTRELAPAPIAVLELAGDPSETIAGDIDDWWPATNMRVEPDTVEFDIHAPAAGVVVINEVWYPGWRALVDGAPTKIHRANGLVRAIFVADGAHRIALSFEPLSGLLLRWLQRLTLISALALLVWVRWRSGAHPVSHSPRSRS